MIIPPTGSGIRRVQMEWGLCTFLTLLLPMPSAIANADVLVLRVSGPGVEQVKPGTRLRDGTRLEMGRADRIVVLDARGTREISGPTEYVVGARRLAVREVTTARMRNRLAGTRQGEGAGFGQIAELIDQAHAASQAGDFATADALLSQIGQEGIVDHRAECRLVENIQLYSAIANGEPLETISVEDDRCAEVPIAPGTEALEQKLDEERDQLIEAGALQP